MIGFVLIQTFFHQGSPISVQGILNGLAAQGHGRGGISQGMSSMRPDLSSDRLSTLSSELCITFTTFTYL